jgi:arsenate reductase
LYLEDTPGAAEILDMAGKLGKSVADLLRRGESAFKEAADLPDLSNDAALAAWLEAHPIVLERPIVVDMSNGKAVIGRPPENVKELLF